MPLKPLAILSLSLLMLTFGQSCSDKTDVPTSEFPTKPVESILAVQPEMSHRIRPSEFEFSPEDITSLEGRFLANISEGATLQFPPLADYKAVTIKTGADDAFCQDALNIVEENLKPQNKETPLQIESLVGYEAVYLKLKNPGSSLFSTLADNAPTDGRINILPPISLDFPLRTNVNLVDFNLGPNRTRLLFTSYAASWRGFGGQIVALKKPDLPAETWESMTNGDFFAWVKSADNAVMISDYFVGQDSKIILSPDNRLFLQRLPIEPLPFADFYLLPHEIKTQSPHCRISWDPAKREVAPKPSLAAYTNQLSRIQGQSTGGGTLNSHWRLQGLSSLRRSQIQTAPWHMKKPYNKLRRLKSQLRVWSFSDPWARREYLNLLSKYDAAYADIAQVFEEIYGNPLSDNLIKQSIFYLTGAYFNFPAGFNYSSVKYNDNVEVNNDQAPVTTQIYLGKAGYKDVAARIDVIQSELDVTAEWTTETQQLHEILAASLYNSDIFSSLLRSKSIPVDTPNIYGKTALMFTAHLNMPDKTNRLLEAGADVNAVTNPLSEGHGYWVRFNKSRSALDYAIENSEIEIIEMLLARDAKLAPLKLRKYSSNTAPLADILEANPHLDAAQKTDLENRIAPRVIVPFIEK